jgi:hypothetical protein
MFFALFRDARIIRLVESWRQLLDGNDALGVWECDSFAVFAAATKQADRLSSYQHGQTAESR